MGNKHSNERNKGHTSGRVSVSTTKDKESKCVNGSVTVVLPSENDNSLSRRKRKLREQLDEMRENPCEKKYTEIKKVNFFEWKEKKIIVGSIKTTKELTTENPHKITTEKENKVATKTVDTTVLYTANPYSKTVDIKTEDPKTVNSKTVDTKMEEETNVVKPIETVTSDMNIYFYMHNCDAMTLDYSSVIFFVQHEQCISDENYYTQKAHVYTMSTYSGEVTLSTSVHLKDDNKVEKIFVDSSHMYLISRTKIFKVHIYSKRCWQLSFTTVKDIHTPCPTSDITCVHYDYIYVSPKESVIIKDNDQHEQHVEYILVQKLGSNTFKLAHGPYAKGDVCQISQVLIGNGSSGFAYMVDQYSSPHVTHILIGESIRYSGTDDFNHHIIIKNCEGAYSYIKLIKIRDDTLLFLARVHYKHGNHISVLYTFDRKTNAISKYELYGFDDTPRCDKSDQDTTYELDDMYATPTRILCVYKDNLFIKQLH